MIHNEVRIISYDEKCLTLVVMVVITILIVLDNWQRHIFQIHHHRLRQTESAKSSCALERANYSPFANSMINGTCLEPNGDDTSELNTLLPEENIINV